MKYLVTNKNYLDLFEYDYINKEDVLVETIDNEVLKYEEVDWDYFNAADICMQFTIIEINTLEELEKYRLAWGGQVVIRPPYNLKKYKDYPVLLIYSRCID